MIIRTSRGVRFDLLKRTMRERSANGCHRWFLYRADLKEALAENSEYAAVGLTNMKGKEEPTGRYGLGEFPLVQGGTQRHKRFLRIGCMRFVGKERQKLIRWAKGTK